MSWDLIIRNGLVFDGSGTAGVHADLAIKDGVVVAVGALDPAEIANTTEVLDAAGAWVMPGFIDNHTHYDAEILMAPGLPESVRHGVTTVAIGSCSLSTILCEPEDGADLFSRVEALPRQAVLDSLTKYKTWSTPAEYVAALDALPLGPNIASYIGHSDMRVAAMGLGPATDGTVRPTSAQQDAMEAVLVDALDAGLMGFSSMTNPWDKIGGHRFRSRRLPSTYATWAEYRRFHAILRERGKILQSAPNITTKVNAILFLAESSGFGIRKPLKTTLITAADTKSNPLLSRAVTDGVHLWNTLFAGDTHWQSIPMPFEVYADGIDLVVFEEFGAGEEALHLIEASERKELFADPAYRRRFRKDYSRKFGPRVWHRDFYDAKIVACPDQRLPGKSFGEVADERGEHPVDVFLDLIAEHGSAVRWRTTIANHRQKQLERIVAHPSVQIGFADSGAHLRNMAFYNFPLYFLRTVKRSIERGDALMTIGKAVHRLTGEQGAWYGLDAGFLRVGDRADVAIVNPDGLDDSIDDYHEAPMACFGGLRRMVKRNDAAIRATLIGGELVFRDGQFADAFDPDGRSKTRGFGRFLRAGEKVLPRCQHLAQRPHTVETTGATR
jgi:N-acyl-D-aspartate/D-glutamate deacylase